ncbi:MAG TPA: Asp-tRNA(Asn)/Glu-tRNA(Gln) amidotransferase GatCAB subunit B, partial [bacterium]
QDTRLFDSKKGVTYSMRTKEYAHDYRYFPEPDLLPLIMDEKWIEEIKSTLPELPDDKYGRFIKEYQLPDYDVGIITSTRVLADYFEECVKLFPKPKMVSNWIMTEVLRVAKKENDIGEISIEPRDLIELFKLIDNGAISLNMAKEVFEEAYNTGTKPLQIVERKGVSQISDADSLKTIIAEVVKNHPDQVNQYLSGKDKVLGFLVGRVMKASGGRANPQKVNELLQKYLKGGQQA